MPCHAMHDTMGELWSRRRPGCWNPGILEELADTLPMAPAPLILGPAVSR
jgi:hypothetical protein